MVVCVFEGKRCRKWDTTVVDESEGGYSGLGLVELVAGLKHGRDLMVQDGPQMMTVPVFREDILFFLAGDSRLLSQWEARNLVFVIIVQ